MKRANIFDPIQKELDQKVFSGITPRPGIRKFILDEMQKVLTPELGFDPLPYMKLYLTGSLTTYQYDKTSDCDVSVFVDWDRWPTMEDPKTIRRRLIPIVMDKLDGTELPGTRHPIQHFIVPFGTEPHDLYKSGLRSAYDFESGQWLVPPEKDRVHDISVELPVLYHRAEMMADKMNVLLETNPIYAKEFWHQIHRKRQMDQKAGKGDFSEGNIVYKYLLHNGYFDRIRDELGERISKVAGPFDKRERNPAYELGRATAVMAYQPQMKELAEQVYNEWKVNDYFVQGWNSTMDWIEPMEDRVRQMMPPEVLQDYATQFNQLRQSLGKVATGLPGEDILPAVGQVWTISDPWAKAQPNTQPKRPERRTVEIYDLDDDRVHVRDLDRDEVAWFPMRLWYDWVNNGRVRLRTDTWHLQQTPEEAADLWDDTLPENWSKQAATMRLFIAFEPPENIVAEIVKWQKQNVPEGAYPAPPENLHMTIVFLGDTDVQEIPEIQEIISRFDPSTVTFTGPIEYRKLGKASGALIYEESGGTEIWAELHRALQREPQFNEFLAHTTVWQLSENSPDIDPPLPQLPAWTPTAIHLYKSEKAPGGGGLFTPISKTADDLSWVDKSTPYGTPDGGVVTGPTHPGDDHIDLPSEPGRDVDLSPVQDKPGSLKVIYDFERDQIILGDIHTSEKFPPGQIVGDYKDGDVVLNHNAEAWFNADYFKRLWVHSFPKRPIRHVILDHGDGNRKVVHRGHE